ncbi:indole-3-glycerol phosphate synthase TrpC [Halalkalibacter akibai]|uniref:Indole-3-glycerol phosphate synthase n=1 Tax=Halalkalibacter akibai (strain ATCC 43226 / DSM 21942 / CIP 109018 / JCM 9157 / 1139) TaxID=1236973 RepID=W4QR39_HALA3|nr:indole-3-glycerol phosphate synthase TrpC [Halalkalibacter akibai]GAE34560.1 indole-3-glycerol phosphate synthase [Halalkalibacter akibai JCM 9157]
MLEKILETKRDEISKLILPDQVEVPHYSLFEALSNPNRSIGLIAEVKKASPSKGVIKEHFDPVEIARGYEVGGADAISVLTDVSYFQGHRDYLKAIKTTVSIPVMRKDFIIDKAQIDETVRIGADAMLLIVGTVPISKLKDLYDYAYSKGLECLVEVHAKEELVELISEFHPKIIGVNNRNLKTFETSLTQTEEMADLIPDGSIFISESGIHKKEDLDRVLRAGASAVLVGESLMRAETPETGIKVLYGGEQIATST